MKDWFRTYGWKFVVALIVAAAAMAYIVHAERKAKGDLALTRGRPSALVQLPAA